jgi:hypothetical protein
MECSFEEMDHHRMYLQDRMGHEQDFHAKMASNLSYRV